MNLGKSFKYLVLFKKKFVQMKKIVDIVLIFFLSLILGPIIMWFIRNNNKDNWFI